MSAPSLTKVLDLVSKRGATLVRSPGGRLRVRPPGALTPDEIESLRPWADVLHSLAFFTPLTPDTARDLHRILGAGTDPEAEAAFARVVRAFRGPYFPGAVLRAVELPPVPKRHERDTKDESKRSLP